MPRRSVRNNAIEWLRKYGNNPEWIEFARLLAVGPLSKQTDKEEALLIRVYNELRQDYILKGVAVTRDRLMDEAEAEVERRMQRD